MKNGWIDVGEHGHRKICTNLQVESSFSGVASTYDDVLVSIRDDNGNTVMLKLPCRNQVKKFGGIGGQRVDRPVVHCTLTADGFDFIDYRNVTFIEPEVLPYAVIGLDEMLDQDASKNGICFSLQGYRPRLCKIKWL
jgi:hypothetical protein